MAACGAIAGVVVAAYVLHATTLVRYPWDWSPDEGLHLDYARRAAHGLSGLYPLRAVPFPSAYGPLFPLLLSPFVGLPHPLAAARVLALAWTLAGCVAATVLAHRAGGTSWALACLALYLGDFDVSFWHMLVRVDGPMLSLWLWSAVVLLPSSVERGADRLSATRLLAGAGLLIAGSLVKPTALVHGGPLVLGWLLVDVRSAARLTGTLGAMGLAAFATLDWLTSGGFSWVNQLWTLHPQVPGQAASIAASYFVHTYALTAFAAAGLLAALALRTRPLRQPAGLLVLGGLAALLLLGKHGASWNYLVPLHAATVVAAVACWALAAGAIADRGLGVARALAPLAATLALLLALTRRFPLPTTGDRDTAGAFYGSLLDLQRQAGGGPLLVSRPDLAYFLAGQPVEVEGSSFLHLAAARVRGTEDVLAGLREGRYSVLVETWALTQDPTWRRAIGERYRHLGGCRLGYYYGRPLVSHILVREGADARFAPPPGTRCFADPAPPGPKEPSS